MMGRTYNDANELTTMTVGGVSTTYTYDDWGRTISKADGTHTATYTWLFGDKLKAYTSDFPGEADVAYNYDGLGKRRNRLNNPNGAFTDADLTWYRWDAAWNLIGEYESGDYTVWDVGALEKWYQGKAAHVDGSNPASGAYNYYAHDHLGSPRGIYSQTQAVIATQEYTPYGTQYATAGPVQSIGFTGHMWDADTQTYYAPFRFYSPGNARWLSRDPLGMVDGPNVYGYVRGNPIRRVDPLGLSIRDMFPPNSPNTSPGPGWTFPFGPPMGDVLSSCILNAVNRARAGVLITHSTQHCLAVCELKKCGVPGWIGTIVNAFQEIPPSDDWLDDWKAGYDGSKTCPEKDCGSQCRKLGY
ncbi:MAG: hypothetical protein GC168_13185 [Candidatus Hydrogenedens sp.]|nr:hypothetical protein [Candidatus Hydrogenedens sp.]